MIFFIGSIVGMIVDLVLLTNLYQRKYPIKLYWLMGLFMIVASALSIVIFKNEFRIIFQNVFVLSIIYLFTRDIKAINYFSFSFALLSLTEVFILETLTFTYNYIFILSIIIKIFLVVIVFKEINRFSFKLSFKPITNKVLYILFSFICLCFSMYVNLNWR